MFGGSLSEAHAEKICKVMDLAVRNGAPGDRPQRFRRRAHPGRGRVASAATPTSSSATPSPPASSRRSPRSSARAPAGRSTRPAITDFMLMVRGTSYMFVTGPNVVKTVTHEDVTFEELGGADTHAGKSGRGALRPRSRAGVPAADPRAGRLPAAEQHATIRAGRGRPTIRRTAGTRRCSTHRPRQSQPAVRHARGDPARRRRREFYEVHGDYRARNIVVGFARLGGRRVGIVANQPAVLAGVLDINASRQGGAVRPLLRRLQHPARDLRGRPRLPARGRAGARRHHHARRQAALRLLRGDGAQAHRDHPQGVRRGLRRHELQAHPRRHELRLADRRDRRDGAQGGGGDPLQATRSPRRRTRRRQLAETDRGVHAKSSPTPTWRRPEDTSTTSSTRATPGRG